MAARQAGDVRRFPWIKFHMDSWGPWFDEPDPNDPIAALSSLSECELGRCMRKFVRTVRTGVIEQVSGNEKWLYAVMVRDYLADMAEMETMAQNRSAGQKNGRGQNSENSEISDNSQIAPNAQIAEASPKIKIQTKTTDIEKTTEGDGDETIPVSPEREKEKIKKENAKDGPLARSKKSAKTVQEQRYGQRPNTERMEITGTPEWMIEHRDLLIQTAEEGTRTE